MDARAAVTRFLPPIAIATIALTVGATILVAGSTLGYDFLAYHAAAARVLAGQPAYDTSYAAAGGFGLFYYPPTFIPLVLPFGLVSDSAATAAWIGLLLVATGAGVALMPVSRTVRWVTILLAAQSWPFLYAIKLGQVGPILLLLFVIGWRWMDRPAVAGGAAALGTAIKLQPALVFVWAALTRRWALIVAGAVVLAALAVAALAVAGAGAWSDFMLLVGRVSDPVSTAHNVTPGAVAFQLGAPRDLAAAIQWLSVGAALVAVVGASIRLPAVASYLVTVVASQLISPILWDHYAMLLLVPVAWLLDRGRWWAALIPLATSVVLIGVVPAWVYPLAFWTVMLAVIAVAFSEAPNAGRLTLQGAPESGRPA